jgi:hypothetical protein
MNKKTFLNPYWTGCMPLKDWISCLNTKKKFYDCLIISKYENYFNNKKSPYKEGGTK